MRKIETKEIIEKRSERNKLIVGLVLVVIMVLSVAGYAILDISNRSNGEQGGVEAEDKADYRGLEFNLLGEGLWHFKIENYEFQTAYNPLETENISVPFLVSYNEYYGKPLYFVVDEEDKMISGEIGNNINYFPLRMHFACIEKKNCGEDLPLKNCTDNIIIIKPEVSKEKKLYREDNCIFIEYGEENLRAADALVFKILGVRE